MDLSTAQAHLDAWLAASLAVAKGQSYSIGERSLTRVDAETIQKQIDYWQRKVNALTAQGSAESGTFAANNPGVALAKWQ